MEWIQKNYRYILFFCFTFLVVFVLLSIDNTYDAVWEYGMSHAIRMGEIPYRDFNTVSTPFFIMAFSIGLFLYDSFSVFLIEFCLLYTFLYYLLYRLLGKNSIWCILSLCIFLFHGFIPSYNAMTFVLVVLLMVLEKEKKSDFWIGVVFGFLILSKHTIGFPVFFLSCIGIHDFKRILKRINGCVIPILLFLIYLLITNSFFSFFDLCFLGLFDFGSSNHVFIPWCIVLTICMVLILFYFFWKDKDPLLYFYALGSIFFVFPICDLSHIPFFTCIFLASIFSHHFQNISFKQLPHILVLLFFVLNLILRIDKIPDMVLSPYHHFEGSLFYSKSIPIMDHIIQDASSHDQSIIVDGTGMFFDIVMDRKISYFDVPLYGNYGYHGSQKMIQKIQKMHDTYFYLDYHAYDLIVQKKNLDESQLDVDVIGYIVENAEEVGKVEMFSIYYLE